MDEKSEFDTDIRSMYNLIILTLVVNIFSSLCVNINTACSCHSVLVIVGLDLYHCRYFIMGIPPPPTFRPGDSHSDTNGQSWKSWKQSFEIYLEAKGVADAGGKRKVCLLLHFLGPDGIKLYNTFDFRPAVPADADHDIAARAAEDKNNLVTVLAKFDTHYGKGKMRNLRRQAFLRRSQESGETVMDFIADLRYKAGMCEYGDTEESMLCDRIIDGLIDTKTKRELLDLDEELNLSNAIRICRREELTNLQMRKSNNKAAIDVGYVAGRNAYRSRGRRRGTSRGRGSTRGNGGPTRGYGRSSRGYGGSSRGYGGSSRGNGGSSRGYGGSSRGYGGSSRGYGGSSRGYGGSRGDGSRANRPRCDYCTSSHALRQCPAFNKYCGACGTKGHYARSPRCPQKQRQISSVNTQNTDNYDNDYTNEYYVNSDNYYNDYADEYYADNCTDEYDAMNDMFDQCATISDIFTCMQHDEDAWLVDLNIDGKCTNVKIDTGAACSVMSTQSVHRLGSEYVSRIQPSDMILNGIHSSMKSNGVIRLLCCYKSRAHVVEFQIVNKLITSLLSKQDSVKFGMISRVNSIDSQIACDPKVIIDTYSDVFDETIGCIPGEYHIKLTDQVEPVVVPPRAIPAPIRAQVKEELDHLERTGIIAKMDEPTDWVNPMVCIRKNNNRYRLCIDPFSLNKCIKREHHPMHSIDDIITRLHGSKYFTTLDANMGFYQIKLSEDSSKLTTFNTPFGRYRHLRLPMGISSAPEIYQRAMDDVCGSLDGI